MIASNIINDWNTIANVRNVLFFFHNKNNNIISKTNSNNGKKIKIACNSSSTALYAQDNKPKRNKNNENK